MRTYNVIDADGHVLEPVDIWAKYMDPAYRDRAPRDLQKRVFELRPNFSSYDGFYLALAEALRLLLLTDDAKFAKAPAGIHQADVRVFPR